MNFIKKNLKWMPVVITAIVSGIQTVMDIKQEDRIDDMDNRIKKIEKEL